MGVRPVYKLTTQSGKSLKTTLNHPYLTKQGWKKLKDIKAGEELVVLDTQRIQGGEVKFLGSSQEPGADIGADKDRIKLLELQTNSKDNSIYGRKIMFDDKLIGICEMFPSYIYNPDSSDRDIVSKPFQGNFKINRCDLTAIFNTIKSRDEFGHREVGNQDSIFVFLENLDYSVGPRFQMVALDQSAGIEEIKHPLTFFFAHPAEFVGETSLDFAQTPMDFLQGGGFFRKPGFWDIFTARDNLNAPMPQFPESDMFFSNRHHNLQKKIYHLVSRLSRSIFPAGLSWDRIVSIEPIGNTRVYDIEVEGTHNFLAEGILAHNTYVQKTEDGDRHLSRQT